LITYQTAWLKAHHPLEFTAANLTVESGNSDKIKEFVDEARRAGIRLLPPSVNKSQCRFGVEQGAIRYGLGAIKGVGTRAADLIAQGAESRPYGSLLDLCERLDANVLNKTALEALAQAGACDEFGGSRRAICDEIESALRSSAVTREDRRIGQGLLFAATVPAAAEPAAAAAEWPESERLQREKAALGFYLSGHPFERRGGFLRAIAGHSTATVGGLPGGAEVRIAGMISSVRVLVIKQGRNAGQKMARFVLEDLEGQVAVTCFARTYQTVRDRLVDDAIVFVTGRIDEKSEERALLLDLVEPANEVVRREVGGLVLALPSHEANDRVLARLEQICARHPGHQHLHFDVEEAGVVHRVRAESGIHVSDDLLDELALAVGPGRVSFTRR
jgi:DNA polymerase-3 subunit alpha